MFLFPRSILKNIRPPYVEVTLDKSVDRNIPIQVDWTGKLSDNLILSEAQSYRLK